MEELVRSELKTAAKAQLKGRVGFIILSYIILAIIVGASGVTGVGPLILTGPLMVGFMGILLMIAKGQEPSYNNLFDGFRTFMGGFVAYLLVVIFTALWSLLLIVPGIIAAIRYSQTFYILRDYPEMDGNAAIQKSKEMMDGHKGEYFVLPLSFIWWILLGAITLYEIWRDRRRGERT